MTLQEFQESAANPQAPEPAGLSPGLLALWHDAHGDWDRAHDCAQTDSGRDGAWVHAYLHRKEGDASNARYWYTRAGKAEATASHAQEWADLAQAFFGGAVSGTASTAEPAAT